MEEAEEVNFIGPNNGSEGLRMMKYSINDELSPSGGSNADIESWNYHIESDYIGFGVPNSPQAIKIVHYTLGTLLVLIGIAGATGNSLVLYVFTRYRRLRGGGGPLIQSLACGDLIVSILHILPAYSSFNERWYFGKTGCELYAGSVGLGGMASLLTLSAIAADRFSVIMGTPLTWLSTKKTCVMIWMLCLILTLPPFFGWSRYQLEGVGTSCSWDYTTRTDANRLYYIFLLFFGFFIPVMIIIISYVGILQVVCKQSNRMSGVSRNGVCRKGPTKSDIKTAKVILSIIVCFLTAWTPYAVISLIGQFGNVELLSPLTTALPAVFAKASVIYNPFVYGLSHPHFRSAVRMLRAKYFPGKTTNHFKKHNLSPLFNQNAIINRGGNGCGVKIREKNFCNNKLLEINGDFGTGSGTSKVFLRSHAAEKHRINCRRETDTSAITGRTTLPYYCESSKTDEATTNSEPDLTSALCTRESVALRKYHHQYQPHRQYRTLFRSEFCLEKFSTYDQQQVNTNCKNHYMDTMNNPHSKPTGMESFTKVNTAVVHKNNNETAHIIISEGQNTRWEKLKIFGRRHTTLNMATSPWGQSEGKFSFDFFDNGNNSVSVYESCEDDGGYYGQEECQRNEAVIEDTPPSYYSTEDFHSIVN